MAAAFVLAQQMDSNQIIVVQETEYTGAGKHPTAQLTLMQQMGIEIRRGDPQENIPGKVIVLPQHPRQMRVQEVDLDQLRRSYIKNAIASLEDSKILTDTCIDFLVDETRRDHRFVKETINLLKGG